MFSNQKKYLKKISSNNMHFFLADCLTIDWQGMDECKQMGKYAILLFIQATLLL